MNQEGIEQLKTRIREIGVILWSPAARDMEDEEWRALKREEKDLLREYAENLEHHTVSRCPICGSPVLVAWDPGGLDGPWWWTTCPVVLQEHLACEHFQVFLGAVDLRGREAEEATENVLLGPGKPFVVERLLAKDGVQAVLSRLETDRGDRVYLTSYFAEAPLPPEDLHQEFRKAKYAIPSDDGEQVFSESKFDPWDFDLGAWHAAGKLKWIAPGDGDWVVRDDAPKPFLGIKGTDMSQKAANGKLSLWEAPQGQRNAMYERP